MKVETKRKLFCRSLLAVSFSQAGGVPPHEYTNANDEKAVVVSVGKLSVDRGTESEIEFYSRNGRRLCTLNYASKDGEHGFGVVKAAWTPDSRYFVFSLTSSGGHQSWHAPTLFYNAKSQAIFSLDEYVTGAGISKGDFTLMAPNTVLTEAWTGKAVPASFKLSELSTESRSSHRPFSCIAGKVIRPTD